MDTMFKDKLFYSWWDEEYFMNDFIEFVNEESE